MKDIRQMLSLLKPLLPHMVLTILLGTLGYLSISAISTVGGMAVIQLGGFGEYAPLSVLITIILAAGILRAGFRLSEQYCTHYIAFRLLAIIRDQIFSITRSLSRGQLQQFQKGEYMSIVTKDVELLEVFYAHTIAPVCIGMVTTIIYVGLFNLLHPLYGLAALFSYILIAYIVPRAVYRRGQNAAEMYRSQFGDLSNTLMDQLKGIKELIIFGRQSQTVKLIDRSSKDLNETSHALKQHEGMLKAWTDIALYTAVFLQVILSVYLYTSRQIEAPAALLALLLLFSSFGPSLALSQLSASLVHTFASAKRVMKLLRIKPETEEKATLNISDVYDIQYRDVSFGYSPEKLLYQNVNMNWKKGEIIGIKGANGTGKSTLIALLLQDVQIPSGSILINGLPGAAYDTEALRSQFSIVDAHTVVFSDTLRNNITMYHEGYSDDQIRIACTKAGLRDFIENVPDGLDTYMQEYAANISSGQLQRIALARMFLKDSPVFILDEPTSNLDAFNEKHILQTIKKHASDKLVVIISHNPAVLSAADRAYHIDRQTVKTA